MPANHTAIVDTEGGVRDDQLLVDAHHFPKPLTFRTGTCGGVEGKHLVVGLLKGHAIGLEAYGEIIADEGGHKDQSAPAVTFVEGSLC